MEKTFLNKLESINEQLNLGHYWIIFLKYKRLIIITPIFFGLLGFFVSLNLNPIFQSQATLVIEESTKNIVNIEEVYGGDARGGLRSPNYINNQIQILESDEVIGTLTKDEEIKSKIEIMYKKLPNNFLSKNSSFFNFFKKKRKRQ